MTSVDEELAQATSQSLTIGSSIVNNLAGSSFVLPPKHMLHHNLYSNSLGDIFMDSKQFKNNAASAAVENSKKSSVGVPGFPDFPEFWQGESSGDRKHSERKKKTRCSPRKAKPHHKRHAHQTRLMRMAVIAPFASIVMSARSPDKPGGRGAGKELKKAIRGHRQVRRIETKAKRQERRKRKTDMGEICRGMASIACK